MRKMKGDLETEFQKVWERKLWNEAFELWYSLLDLIEINNEMGSKNIYIKYI